MLAVAATVLCYRAFSVKYDHTLHKAVLDQLSTTFPDAIVRVGHVSQDLDGTLSVTDVLMTSREGPSRDPILRAERVVIRGKLGIGDYVHNRIEVKQLELFGMHLNVWNSSTGSCSTDALQPHPNPNQPPPKLIFKDASVTLYRDGPKSSTRKVPTLDFTGISGFAEQTWEGPPGNRQKAIKTQLSGRSLGTVEHFQVAVAALPEVKAWNAHGNFEKLKYSASLLQSLPKELRDALQQLKDLECEASAAFDVAARPNRAPEFEVRGTILSGRLRHERLPYTLEGLHGEFSSNHTRVQLRNMSASSGTAQLKIDTDIYGFQSTSPITLHAQVRNLELDQRLYLSLPAKLQSAWNKMQPSGKVNGTIKLFFDGQRWTPEMDVLCSGVSIRPWLFPYPVEDIHGRVIYKNATISTPERVVGRAGGQNLLGTFSLTKLEANGEHESPWIGQLDCASEGPVAIDELLLSCLTQRGQETTGAETFVRSLRPSGSVQLSSASFHRSSRHDIWHKAIDASMYSGRINYTGFAYPIYDIRGRIVCNDSQFQLDKFEGRNDSGRIRCDGDWTLSPDGSVPFSLVFDAYDVPIEEELKLALPSETQFVWEELRPLGAIDHVHVSLERLPGNPKVLTSVNITENRRNNHATGRSLRLKPRAFDYLLSDVDCQIGYLPGLVAIDRASGVHDGNEIAISGRCEPVEDGRWKAMVNWLPRTRVRVESELLRALPKSIRDSLVKMDFRGPISVLGTSEITFADRHDGDIETAWDCSLDVEDGQLGDGRYIGAMRGMLKVRGRSHGPDINAIGSLELDALKVLGIPVTQFRGPFAVLGSRLFFGSSIHEALPQAQQDEPNVMSASALSGKVLLNGYGSLETGNFHLDSTLHGAQLDLLLKDLGVESTSAEAVCNAELSFDGIPWEPQGYSGEGKIQLTEAELYELPFMIRLLNATSVDADDSAFQTAEIAFRLDGDHIPLGVRCEGEVLRLWGKGWTNLRRELKLDLYTHIGRRFPIGKVVQPLFPDSRFASFMSVNVTGSLDNPIMTQQVFPQLSMEELFSDSEPEQPASFWQRQRK